MDFQPAERANTPPTQSETQSSPGGYNVPPKVDIVFLVKDTAGIANAYTELQTGMTQFVSGLGTSGWDYHAFTIPMSSPTAITQVIGSNYDGNSASWTPAYPGEAQVNSDTLSANVFRTLTNYSGFLNSQDINYGEMTMERGFQGLNWVIQNGLGNTHALRDDALTEIVVVGYNDTSGVNYCTSSTGQTFPCEQLGGQPCAFSNYNSKTAPYGQTLCGTSASSMAYYQNALQNLHTAGVQMYAAVPNEAGTACAFGNDARVGSRYQQMATALNGQSYDVCNTPISSILTTIAGDLQTTRMSYYTQYLFISQDADPSTITVTRYVGGNTSQPVTIPQGAVNGWTYVGYQTNVYALTATTPTGATVVMDKSSGYAIQLNGTAMISGSDTSGVTYQAAGSQSTQSN